MSSAARRGPGRPPAAKSATTRGRILRTAREIFGEVGYDAATFQEIAERADLTRPAVNHHFPSKRELYREVAEQTNLAIVEAGIREARLHNGFVEQIDAFIATVQAEGSDPAVAAFLVSSVLETQRHPELAADDERDGLSRTREFMRGALAEAQLAGELRSGVDIDAVAETLLVMLIGLGFWSGFCARSGGDRRRVVAVVGELLRMLRGEGFLRSQ